MNAPIGPRANNTAYGGDPTNQHAVSTTIKPYSHTTFEDSISDEASVSISAARKAEPKSSIVPTTCAISIQSEAQSQGNLGRYSDDGSSNTPEQGLQSLSNFAPSPAYSGIVYSNTTQSNRNSQHVDMPMGSSAFYHSRHNGQIPFILYTHAQLSEQR
jgi:hypothetical protein